jgi:hypothetical protein
MTLNYQVYTFYEHGNEKHELRQDFSNLRESYQKFRRWRLFVIGGCDIIVLNMHTATEDKTDDTFYEEIEHILIFKQFPKNHVIFFFF